MRLFVAVFPPPEVQRTLIEAARALPTAEAFRLTAPERVHLTLKFLGGVPPDSTPDVAQTLERATRHAEPFEACVSGFGAFPSPRRARILWAGVGEGAQSLAALARAVEAALEPRGFPPEDRPFVPHLTLGRARHPVPLDPNAASPPAPRFAVREAVLVRSRHTESGIAYDTLSEYSF